MLQFFNLRVAIQKAEILTSTCMHGGCLMSSSMVVTVVMVEAVADVVVASMLMTGNMSCSLYAEFLVLLT